jgi:N-terminal half of MaoC dehydratase
MPLDSALAGRTFAPTEPYQVSRERIVEFCAAIGADLLDGGHTAPPTFPIVVAFSAMTRLMTDPGVGIELHNVVHGEQRFDQTRPVRAGDVLVGTLSIETLRTAAGMDMIGTRTHIATADGEDVCSAFALLLHREGQP